VPAAVVRAEGLVRAFGRTPVLSGVDLRVDAGEVVALLGPNGAGKTTLMRILALLLRPAAGRLSLFDADTPAPALRRRIGYVAHETFCYPDLTAAENLTFYAELFHVPQAPARVTELLAWAGLAGATDRPVRTYSRGMAQRLALVRALVHRPDLLLLDEPFSGLDTGGVMALQARLAELAAAGHTVVLTTHDLERAATIATRFAILHRGRIAWVHDGRAPAVAVIAAAYDEVTAVRASRGA
jgi:heme exporter protein A